MKDNKNTGVEHKKIDIESMRERKKRDGITLDIAYPELAKQLHPTKNGTLTANQITIGCAKKVWWMCEKGHEWEASMHNRSKGCNCPICSNKKILVGYNDLATTHPHVSSEWHPIKNGDLKPTNVTYGSTTKVWWLGGCGHEWQAVIASRTSDKCGCPICAGRQVLIGFNDLESQYPTIAQEWHPTKNDLLPCNIVYGAGKKLGGFVKMDMNGWKEFTIEPKNLLVVQCALAIE